MEPTPRGAQRASPVVFIPDRVNIEARGLGGALGHVPHGGRTLMLVVGGLEAVMRPPEVQGKGPKLCPDARPQEPGSQLTSFGERPRPAARKRVWEVWEGREGKN